MDCVSLTDCCVPPPPVERKPWPLLRDPGLRWNSGDPWVMGRGWNLGSGSAKAGEPQAAGVGRDTEEQDLRMEACEWSPEAERSGVRREALSGGLYREQQEGLWGSVEAGARMEVRAGTEGGDRDMEGRGNAEGALETTGRLVGGSEGSCGADARCDRPRPPGAAALMLLLPATMFHLLLVVRSGPARLLGPPPYLPGLQVLWSPRMLLLWLTWLGLQAALYLLPARKVQTRLAGLAGGSRPREAAPPDEDTLTPYRTPFVPAGC